MDSNLIWQYTAVGAVFLLLAVLLFLKARRRRRNPGGYGGCCGCSLADTCAKNPDNNGSSRRAERK